MNPDDAAAQGGAAGARGGPAADRRVQEQRRYERLKAGLRIQYRPLDPDEEDALEKQGNYVAPAQIKANTAETRGLNRWADEAGAVTEDISLGGLKLHSGLPLDPGTRLRLELVLPEVPIPVNATAEVRWCLPVAGQAGRFNSGLRFIGISKNDLDKVERFLTLQKRAQLESRG